MNQTVIEAKNLSKQYIIRRRVTKKDVRLYTRFRKKCPFYALQDVSFSVRAGEAVGLVGLNGSGKTTLSNLIAGVSMPSCGAVQVTGEASLIGVNAGLSNDLTGLENIEQKGLLIGLTRRRIRELTPEIVRFADVGAFIDQPVRKYSSGMRSRLAFAISINIDPDILVIDEGLSVGDSTFTDRCLERVKQFRENGKTMVFTSHSPAQMKKFCDRLIWLEGGRIRMDDTAEIVMKEYDAFIKWYNNIPDEEKRDYMQQIRAWQFKC